MSPPRSATCPTSYVWLETRKLSNTAYIRFNLFLDLVRVITAFSDVVKELRACDGLIVDLRGNPGGIGGMAMGLAGFLVDKPGQRLGTMYMRDATLNFVINPRTPGFAGPVAILVDGCSASTSEIFAGGLQDLRRARVFGTRTAAAALPSVIERLPNGDGFQYAVANYISEGGKPFEGLGVKPDVEVKLTRAALLTGHDAVIDAAMDWINKRRTRPMTRRWVILAAILYCQRRAAADEALPEAATVLDRYIEVTGGKEAYAKHKSEIETGTLDYPAQGLKAKITRYAAEPDSYLASVEITGIGKMDTGVTDGSPGRTAWCWARAIKSGEEKALALREATFNAVVQLAQTFPKVETTGTETVDGDVCYKVLLTPAEGRAETRYYSRESGLLVKATTVAATQMGDIPVEFRYSAYKEFNGVRSPTVVTQKAATQEFTVTIESLRVNEDIPAAKFALPPEVHAIVDKASK